MAQYFQSPHCEYKALRIQQLLVDVGEKHIAARPNGQVICNTQGHVILFDLNELGQLYKVDNADIVRPEPDNTVILEG